MSSIFAKVLAGQINPDHVDAFTPLGYKPTPPQELFHESSRQKINWILYGGAAGGGKSCAALLDAIDFAVNVAGIRIACFRRTYPELEESFLAELAERDFARPVGGIWTANNKRLRFPNTSSINFTYAENEVDASRVQGGQYQLIYIDEAALMPESVIQMLAERMRSADRRRPVYGLRLMSNPGGLSHQWLKDTFITPTLYGRKSPIEVQAGKNSKRTRTVAFIPAKFTDNPYLDDGYESVLDSIEDPQRRAAMRDGDWDAAVGQFFEQWRHSLHVVPWFQIPLEWLRYTGVDWGYRAAWAACCIAVDQDGRLWVYREHYATQVDARDQAHIILEAEIAAGETNNFRVGDPSMWGKHGTPLSVADMYGQEGCGLYPANNDRINGWARCHEYLNMGPACEYHRAKGLALCPMLHVFEETCPNFVKYIPALPRDPHKPDDALTIGKGVEDHMPDAFRYAVMMIGAGARPIIHSDVDPEMRSAAAAALRDPSIEAPKDVPRDQGQPLQTMGGGLFVVGNRSDSIFS